MGLWDRLLNWLSETIVGDIVDLADEFLIGTVIDIILYTPYPTRDGEVAIIREPTNAPWEELHSFAFEGVLPVVFTLIFISYLLTYFIDAFPGIGAYQKQNARGNLLTALFLSWLAWPLGVVILAGFSGITQALAPANSEIRSVLTDMFVVLASASLAIPGVEVFSTAVSLFSLSSFLVAVFLYIGRLVYLFGFMFMIQMIASFKLSKIPILRTVASVSFVFFVTLAVLPMFVAVSLRAIVLFHKSGLPVIDIPAVESLIVAAVPLIAISLFGGSAIVSILVPFVNFLPGMGGGMMGLGSTGLKGSTAVTGSVSSAESDSMSALEQKAADWDERLQSSRIERGTQTAKQTGAAAAAAAPGAAKSAASRVDQKLGSPGSRAAEGARSTAEQINNATPNVRGNLGDLMKTPPSGFGTGGERSGQTKISSWQSDDSGGDDTSGGQTAAGKLDQQFEGSRPEPGNVDPGATVDEPVPVRDSAFDEVEKSQFEKAVDNSDLSRSEAREHLRDIRQRFGQEGVEQKVDDVNFAAGMVGDPDDLDANDLTADQQGGSRDPTGVSDLTPSADDGGEAGNQDDKPVIETVDDLATSSTSNSGSAPTSSSSGTSSGSPTQSSSSDDSSGGRDPVEIVDPSDIFDGGPGD